MPPCLTSSPVPQTHPALSGPCWKAPFPPKPCSVLSSNSGKSLSLNSRLETPRGRDPSRTSSRGVWGQFVGPVKSEATGIKTRWGAECAAPQYWTLLGGRPVLKRCANMCDFDHTHTLLLCIIPACTGTVQGGQHLCFIKTRLFEKLGHVLGSRSHSTGPIAVGCCSLYLLSK